MEQLNEDLLYLVFEYLPLDIKIQVGGKFMIDYETRNIQRNNILEGYEYILDGQLYCSDGPARTRYYQNGSIRQHVWSKFYVYHHPEQFGIINYYPDGSIESTFRMPKFMFIRIGKIPNIKN